MAVGGIQISFEYTVPVFSRFAPGWPTHGDAGLAPADRATYGPLADACAQAWEWDAHFAAYAAPHVPRRLATAASLEARPCMTLFVADVDGPGHQLTAEWWAGEKDKLRALFRARGAGYAYATKGGYRIVYGLAEPLELATTQDALRWRASYEDWLAILAAHGIAADDKCADWTRCYRLPRVRRDGVDVVPLEEVGSPSQVVRWRAPYAAPDDPRVLRALPVIEVPVPAPVDEDARVAAAFALGKQWPERNRHNAGLALAGALAKAGWSEEAVCEFLAAVFFAANGGDPWFEEAQASAKSSADKLARGEEITGWATLADLMCSGTDGQVDEGLRAAVEGAVGAARKLLGQGPPLPLFDLARSAAAGPTAGQEFADALAVVKGEVPPPEPPVDDVAGALARISAAVAATRPDLAPDGEANPHFVELCGQLFGMLEPRLRDSDEKRKHKRVPQRMGMSARQLLARNLPPPEYLVQDFIVAGGVTALSGEPKTGKSWDMTHITMCLASGQKVYGKFEIPAPAGTFYFYAEDPEASITTRVRAIAAGMGIAPDGPWVDNWYAQPRGKSLDVLDDYELCVFGASAWLAEEEAAAAGRPLKFRLLALDPLSDVHSGEEDKRDSMAVVMHRLRALAGAMSERAGVEVQIAFVHHSGKTSEANKGRKRGGQKMRGSSAIHGAVDNGIYIDNLRGDEKSEFTCRMQSEVKSARGGGTFDRTLKLDDDERGHATKATFTCGECAAADDKASEKAEEKAFAVVKCLWNQGAPLIRDELKRKLGGGSATIEAAIKLALEEAWIAPHMRGMKQCGYEITDAGRALVRGDGEPEPGSDPGVIVDDQSGGAAPGKPPIHLAGFLGAIAQN